MNRLGCCGLNCEECPVFTATVKNDNNLRQTTAVEWSKLYAGFLKKPLELSDMSCEGCHSKSIVFTGCSSCPIRSCCSEKKQGTCAECGEFDQCEMLSGFFSYGHQKAKENLTHARATR